MTTPLTALTTLTLSDLQARIQHASAQRTPLCIRGGGSKDWYGQTPQGEVLDVSGYHGVVAYEPTELVITVKAGTRLQEVQTLLAAQGQYLPFEPPQFSAASTIGGVVAAGLAGPRRAQAGGVRDFVLGASLLNGAGEHLHFGGQVMKNVAGYDVSRLLAGSLGVLGVITQVSLKVLPLPAQEQTLRFAMDETTALAALNTWGGQPLPISASAWQQGTLSVRLSGAAPALVAAQAKMGAQFSHELVAEEDATLFWQSLRDQTHAFFTQAGGPTLWRLSVPSTAPALPLGGQLIEWGGAQRWVWSDLPVATLREQVAQVGGHATIYRTQGTQASHNKNDSASPSVFHPVSAPLLAIHQRLKHEFDPAGIFNPGRLYPFTNQD
ncbi:glycolate oxidase subunit GlcE [Parvibium lacunae]|uniref:Glycolate oxidase subunit GlcE n=1 Tax=Parvibium lacunae TaxID=1888893 RepID=A0A368L0E9_9BURK|nr:glycolate oxidase subunit GlcE [Parvibium lacunae]RCS56761.1 glycolate oxidase subunit GlcE [Parvibium lacunae]